MPAPACAHLGPQVAVSPSDRTPSTVRCTATTHSGRPRRCHAHATSCACNSVLPARLRTREAKQSLSSSCRLDHPIFPIAADATSHVAQNHRRTVALPQLAVPRSMGRPQLWHASSSSLWAFPSTTRHCRAPAVPMRRRLRALPRPRTAEYGHELRRRPYGHPQLEERRLRCRRRQCQCQCQWLCQWRWRWRWR